MTQNECLKFLRDEARILLLGMICSSCNNHHESETEQLIRTEFRKNYQAAAVQSETKPSYLDKLERIEKSNPDSYRSIAFTWQNAAIQVCQTDSSLAEVTQNKSSYELLLQEKQTEVYESYQIDNSIKLCVQNFYVTNLVTINKMIDFNDEVN